MTCNTTVAGVFNDEQTRERSILLINVTDKNEWVLFIYFLLLGWQISNSPFDSDYHSL